LAPHPEAKKEKKKNVLVLANQSSEVLKGLKKKLKSKKNSSKATQTTFF
jgi:hypothetical protein